MKSTGSSTIMKKDMNNHSESDNGYDAEAFSEENAEQINNIIGEIFRINRGGETMIVEEVLRIKSVLEAYSDQSEVVLLEPLRRLQLLAISFDTLKETMIGKSVKGLTKHNSKRVREHARYLIIKWRRTVDQWVMATDASAAIITMEVVGYPSSLVIVDEQEKLKTKMEASATTKTTEVVGCPSSSIIVDEQEKLRTKMEASKRKLKEGYQRAKNAKKQRRVQVVELKDLPRQEHNNQKGQGRNKKGYQRFLIPI